MFLVDAETDGAKLVNLDLDQVISVMEAYRTIATDNGLDLPSTPIQPNIENGKFNIIIKFKKTGLNKLGALGDDGSGGGTMSLLYYLNLMHTLTLAPYHLTEDTTVLSNHLEV